ncbi:MAG: (Fe-S)-binding protein [Anaerolineales bacterium]
MEQLEKVLIADERWERLLELTGGAAAICYQCGACTAVCPWGLIRQEPLSVRLLVRKAQLGIADPDGQLWLCTHCAQCEAHCPRGVNVRQVIDGLRQLTWEQNQAHSGLPTMLWSLYWNNNPWSQPPSQRSLWAEGLHLPRFDPAQHEILLYAGCTASYDRRAQKVARAVVKILQAAGVAVGYLAEDEPCCGEPARSVGHMPFFLELAERAANIFERNGVATLVTISPHCYDVFRNHYPRRKPNFHPLHYTQYLAKLVAEGRLQFSEQVDQRITYQDPCYLGRDNGEYQAARHTLGAIPGVELVEMEPSAEESLCCGGGGGRMWLETEAGQRFGDLRVQQANQSGATILATACPFCLACLEDSVKASRMAEMHVMDIAELALRAL